MSERGGQSVTDCPLDSPPVEGECPVAVRPLLSSKRGPNFKICRRLGKNKNMIMGPDGMRNKY
jgi:hypothetical protein